MTIARSKSGLLDRDLLHDVGDLLERVDGTLERLDDVLQLEDLDRLVVATEELGERAPIALVTRVLQAVDLDPVLVEVDQRPKLRHRLRGDLRATLDHLELGEELRRDL